MDNMSKENQGPITPREERTAKDQIDLNGNVGEASKFYDCHISNISNVLIGKNQTACGFKWRYKNVK